MRSLPPPERDADLIAWLVQQGVTIDAITSPRPIQVRHVVFNNGAFSDCAVGEKAIIFDLVADIGEQVAWDPINGRIATRLGLAWGLGQDQLGVEGMGTTGSALPIHRAPLEWLRCGRLGAVVVDWDLAGRVLAGVTVEAANDLHADQLQRRLRLPGPTVVVRGRAHRPELEVA